MNKAGRVTAWARLAGIVALPAAVAVVIGGCASSAEPVADGAGLSELHDVGQLRTAFNRNAGKPRLVLLLSPSCPTCVVGASWVRQHVLADHPGVDLAVIAVWLPQFPGDTRSRWDPTLLTDRRVTPFWDQDSRSGRWFKAHIKLPYDTGPVLWDAYLLYGPNARWTDLPGPLISTGRPVIGSTAELEHDLQPLLPDICNRIAQDRVAPPLRLPHAILKSDADPYGAAGAGCAGEWTE